MIITAKTRPSDFKEMDWQSIDDGRFFIAWRGSVYLNGLQLGAATVQTVARRLVNEPLADIRPQLHGVFLLLVFDRLAVEWTACVDNSGLFHAYYDTDCLSTSLLETIAVHRLGIDAISPESVADFIATMGVHWGETLVRGVRAIGADELLTFTGDERIQVTTLPGGRRLVQDSTFQAVMDGLGRAVDGVSTSVDLTGGVDSRLIACLLDAMGVEFETAVSGHDHHPDVEIGTRAAAILHRPCFVSRHDASSVEHELEELFRLRDGNWDVLEYHRSGHLQRSRQERGIEVSVSGAGGEMFKDHWWLQDFPRYRSPSTRFDRLYDLRLAPIRLPSGLLAGEVAAAYANVRSATLERLEVFRAPINTQSYDRAFFHYQMPVEAGGFLTNHTNNFVPVLAPYLEYDSYRFGEAMPRHLRVLNKWHREMISKACPKLAALEVTSGGTAGVGARFVVRNTLGQATKLGRRAVNKIGHGTFGRPLIWISADSPELSHVARRTAMFSASFEALKDVGFVHRLASPEDIPDVFVGRFLTLGMLVQYAEGGRSAH